jgi:gamma-glutamyl:cysteine ligase YbdK (ATP-grasp superfamily)
MPATIHRQIVTVGVEEEFHIVDLATRQLTAQADKLMERLPDGSFSWELQGSVLEANSRPWAGLLDLAEACRSTTCDSFVLSHGVRSPDGPQGKSVTGGRSAAR